MGIEHIAFIMDGNGRWAKKRGKPRTFGHRQGLKTAENVINWCLEHGIKVVSLYVFSTENWKRPKKEIDTLFKLANGYLDNFAKFTKDKIRVVVSGSRDRLPNNIIDRMETIQRDTAQHNNMTVNLCINYGGRQEIVDACNAIIKRGEQVSEETLNSQICGLIPMPDLIVRTGGQVRLSNFLLYQSAYAELSFTNTLWPDFNTEQLACIVEEFSNRTRNYGGLLYE